MYNWMVIKIILFDFDGTLADSFENFFEILREITLKYKLPELSPKDLDELRSESASQIVKKLHIPFYKIPFIAHDMKRLQQQNIENIKSFKGLPEVLHGLKNKGFELGIVTSNGKSNVKAFLKNNDIDIFTYLYCDSRLFGKDKVLKKFLKAQNVSNEEVLYVGDEIRDIQACQKIGVKIAAVTWGFNSKEGLTKYNPELLISTPKELLQLV